MLYHGLSPLLLNHAPQPFNRVEGATVWRKESLVYSICEEIFHLVRVVNFVVVHVHCGSASHFVKQLLSKLVECVGVIAANEYLEVYYS